MKIVECEDYDDEKVSNICRHLQTSRIVSASSIRSYLIMLRRNLVYATAQTIINMFKFETLT